MQSKQHHTGARASARQDVGPSVISSMIVIFKPADFRQDFPQFSDPEKYPDRRLHGAFNAAALLLDNTPASRIPYDPGRGIVVRETLLHYLACHILTLAAHGASGQPGPMTRASQGSVSASFAAPEVTDKSYCLASPCGQTFWQMSLPYRLGGTYQPVKPYHPWG